MATIRRDEIAQRAALLRQSSSDHFNDRSACDSYLFFGENLKVKPRRVRFQTPHELHFEFLDKRSELGKKTLCGLFSGLTPVASAVKGWRALFIKY